jgi:hypothetical protein
MNRTTLGTTPTWGSADVGSAGVSDGLAAEEMLTFGES